MTDCQDLYTWTDEAFYEWIDESYLEFGECPAGILYQVWRDENYAYAVTSSGLDIFDINTANKVAYITNRGGFTTIWGNTETIYLGTSDDGLKCLDKVTISGGDLSVNLEDYKYYYNVTSTDVRYLHGYNNMLAVITGSGIDVLNNSIQGFKSTTSGTNYTKCFMTSKNELYYIIQGTMADGLCKINSILCDWETPDTFYETGVSFLPANQGVNDIFITESTSSNGVDNTVFVATTNGAFVLDEGTTEFDTYYSKDG